MKKQQKSAAQETKQNQHQINNDGNTTNAYICI